MKYFTLGCILGLAILGIFYVHIDAASVNIGTNNSYCGFDWNHMNGYCESAS
jgi:hypothetical protein